MKWAYGVTAHKSRADNLLLKTVASLNEAGFFEPLVFIDGAHRYEVGAFGNFYMSVVELYMRHPNAERFAVFQDDILCCKNLRQYLEKIPWIDRGYLNLYTVPDNEREKVGFSLSDQWGRGAVALVFDNEGLQRLLSSEHFVAHRRNSHNGHKAIDRIVSETFKSIGWREFVHNPGLVQHTGAVSTCGNNQKIEHRTSRVFVGEDFDALSLLELV